MKARLISKQELVKDFWQFNLEQVNQINFEPGQFFNFTLINPPFTDTRGNSRYLGFITTPGKPELSVLIKNGVSAFKKSLLSLPVGTEVEIDKLEGENNITQNPNASIVFIAGGIGIAPVLSMIRYYFEQNLQNKLTLIYANDLNEELPFIEELKNYQLKNPNFKLVLTNNPDVNTLQDNISDPNSNLYFIRGRRDFVIPTMQLVKNIGVQADKISIEIFTGY